MLGHNIPGISEAIFLEGFNAFGAVITTVAAVYFGRVPIQHNGGWRGIPRLFVESFQRFVGNKMTSWEDGSLALCGVFTAEAMTRWGIWIWRHFHLPLRFIVLILAVMLLCVTTICVLRVFSPQPEVVSPRRWAVWILVAIAFAVVSILTR